MKKVVLSAMMLCFLMANICIGQNQKVFEMAYPKTNDVNINENYSKPTTIYPFKQKEAIYSLSVSAKVLLNSSNGFIRLILTTGSGEEYLILESNDMIAEQNQIDFIGYGEETAMLNGVAADSIRLEIADASITIESVSYNNASPNKLNKNDFDFYSKQIKKDQDAVKIDKINKQIKKKGLLWLAGETSVSTMTYEQKKKMFGGKLPNLKGFEYYKGGIFDCEDPAQNKLNATPSSLVTFFDWRNRHGQNWMTAVRNQGSEGSCWAHGTMASLEGVINTYYNQHINADLSEQAFVSCMYSIYRDFDVAGMPPTTIPQCGQINGPSNVFCMVKNIGAVDESCYPYSNVYDCYGLDNNNQACTTFPPNGCTICGNLCSDYQQRLWKLTDFKELDSPNFYNSSNSFCSLISEDSLKANIVRYGPTAFTYINWGHLMCFAGFGIIQQGDTLYSDSTTFNSIIVPANSPLIGKTYWIAKNSWDVTWGDKGYCKLVLNLWDIIASPIITPIIQPTSTNYQVKCTDTDGDGYCFWGIGPRPATGCPVTAHTEEDGDDSSPFLGPLDANYKCTVICPTGYTTLATPTVGTITQPSCTVTSGSVVMNGLPSSGTWTLTRYPDGVSTSGTGTSKTLSGIYSGTYNYTVSNKTQCTSAKSANLVINNPPQLPVTIGTITHPTCALATGSVVLSGLPSSGTWTLIRYPDGITTTGTGTSTTITGIPYGIYYYITKNASGCISVPSAFFTINPQPQQNEPYINSILNPTCTSSTGSIEIGGLPATGTWILTRSDGVIVNGTGTDIWVNGVPPGSYTFIVKNASGCTSKISNIAVIPPQPIPTAPVPGTITQPTSSVPTGSVILSGLPSSGNWTLTMQPGGITTSGSGASTTISGLAAGTYTFTVTNDAGCPSASSNNVVINAPSSGTTVTIGTGTSTQRQPFGMYYGYERSTAIYTNSEIGGTGNINAIAYNVATAKTTSASVKIYIKTTTATTLTAGTWASRISGATTVYSGTLSFPSTGWKTITLPTPFNYTGNNLLIMIETNYGSTGTSAYPYFYYTSSTSKHEYWNADNSAPTGNGTVNSNRPNIQITYSAACTPPTAPVVGTITQPTCATATGSVILNGLPLMGVYTLTRNPGGITTSGTGTSYTVAGIPAGTYTFTVTTAAGCTSASSASVVINSQPTIAAPIIGNITQPTCALATGSVDLSGLPTSVTWTLTRNPGAVTTTGSGTTTTVSGLPAGTYTFTVTNIAGCSSAASVNVVINSQPSISAPVIGTITQPTSTVPTGSVVLSGLPTSVTWTLTRNPGAVTTTGSGTSITVSGLAPGTYTFTVKNIAGCISPASANVIINAVPATATTVTIGTGTSSQRQPFGMYYGYERSAAIYTSAEIGGTGSIISLAVNVASAKTTSASVKIYIKTTTATTLTAGTWATQISGATAVYSGTVSFSSTGWKTITLSTPFNYTGNNLLVLVETNYGGTGNSSYPTFYYSSSTSKHEYWSADNSAPKGNGTVNSNRPNIQITYVPVSRILAKAESTTEYDENNKPIKVYPNPVSNELTIEIDGNTDASNFEIFNSIGQIVFKGIMLEKAVVQTASFTPGIYLIRVDTGKTRS